MSYTVENPTDQPIILSAFEGSTYQIPAGETLEVESERAALTLVDFGARLSSQDRRAALEAEGNREPEEREAVVRAREGRDAGVTTVGSLTGSGDEGAGVLDQDVPVEELKGKALDEQLKAAGLAVDGKVAEKRQRLADHRAAPTVVVVDDEHGGQVEKPVDPDGVAKDGEPATPGGTIVEGETSSTDVAPFAEQNAPVVIEDAAEGTEIDQH